MSQFPLMARFNEWANARLYGAVARLSEEDYRADRRLFFGSVHRTLNHLMVVDRIWTRRIDGEPHGITSLDAQLHDGFEALREARIQEDRRLIRQIDALGGAQASNLLPPHHRLGRGRDAVRSHPHHALQPPDASSRAGARRADAKRHRAAALGRGVLPGRAARDRPPLTSDPANPRPAGIV